MGGWVVDADSPDTFGFPFFVAAESGPRCAPNFPLRDEMRD